jgi:immune inhibitor A
VHTSTRVRRLLAGGTTLAVAASLAATLGSPTQAAVSAGSSPDAVTTKSRSDNRSHPLARKQVKLRKEAMELLATGKAEKEPQRGGGSTVTTESGQEVEFLDNSKQANVWTLLAEFGDQAEGRYGRDPGPLHNQIPEPDRDVDNTTQWTEKFNVAHYNEMFNGSGESFRNFYLNQSNGEYEATVTTDGWVQVPYNGSYYGDNAREDNGGTWDFINHAVDAWADGKSTEEARAYLAQFDQWDRYDFDEDGNFNEADGYIDHFQAVHAGEGEEAGADPDTIWSHRWFADYTTTGQVGPEVNGRPNLQGGQEIGDTGYFIGDYTVEPENGGLGVFAHEYAHDLGLPDFYDTAGGENSTAFWTLMSSGSWMGHGEDSPEESFLYGIGGTPNDMGAEEKLFLGWLNPTVVEAGERARVDLAAAGAAGSNRAVQVLLPDETRTRTVGDPFAGEHAWYSDSGDDLSNSLTRGVGAANTVTVDAMAWWDTETDYDFWYAQYSTDDGVTWKNLGAFDGQSGGWVPQSFTYDAGGEASKFRFLYKTDSGVSEPGVMLDEIKTTADGKVLDTDGAEAATSPWTPRGWLRTTGTITETLPRYYLMENKSYVKYDDTLRTGPYNFSEAVTRPDWVEHFKYQNGMLVWFVNHAVADNNTSEHPGTGYALPVDAMSAALRWNGTGAVVRNRIQAFDATFGLQRTNRLELSRQVAGRKPGSYTTQTVTAPARRMVATFDDTDPEAYYDSANPQGSVKVAGAGVVARVVDQTADTITVRVRNP